MNVYVRQDSLAAFLLKTYSVLCVCLLFADGNGRVGRLLMNYFLILHDHPTITIHEEDRNDYMSALEAWDVSQELHLLKTFLREQTVKTWSPRER